MTTGKITLPESLGISEVTNCHREMIVIVNENEIIEVDDSLLNNIDTAGIQLLLALNLEIKSTNKTISWTSPSDAVRRCAEQLGVSSLLF